MARSDEAKKDLKFKMYVAGCLILLAIPIVALGPGLSSIGNKFIKKPHQPNAARNLLIVAQIQNNSMRSDQAKKTLETWFTLFIEEESRDWDDVMNGGGEWQMAKYNMGDGLEEQGFTPWLWPEGKVAPLGTPANDDLVGEALDLYGSIIEEQKDYPHAAHIYVCLANMWPNDSETQLNGEAGIKRAAIRSF